MTEFIACKPAVTLVLAFLNLNNLMKQILYVTLCILD